ncbi:hypothetical protein [Hyalangium gracile]|uniref:hypothetical protein n=1 Tax=Hyalangium gracile TaxID=394092 RepID=UPI001CCA10A1|nr:hypothetical protein [Hyalangium gracile]
MKTSTKIGLLSSLYLCQGLPYEHFLLATVMCAVGVLYVLLTFHPPRMLETRSPS